MKVKNIVFSGFAAAILMGVAADASAATEIATKAYVDRLDGTYPVAAGQYVSDVTQTDGAVSVTTAALATEIAENVMIAPTTDAVYNYVTEANNLDTLNSTATIADGEYVSSVVQSNGVVNVSKANLSTTITAGDMKAPTTDAVNTAIAGVTSGLNGTDNVTAGQYISAVTQTDGDVSITTAPLATQIADGVTIAPTTQAVYDYVTEANNLDTLNSTATIADGEYVSSVVQSNGVVNVSKANLSTTITAGDMKAPTTDAVNTAIQGVTSDLDGSFTVDAGEYVSAVTQADGAVTVTKANLATEIAEGVAIAPTTDAVYQETKNIPDPDDCQSALCVWTSQGWKDATSPLE